MGKENNIYSVQPEKDEEEIFLQNSISEAINKDLSFDPEKISQTIARSLCEPTESLYKKLPELKNDPFKAMEEVKLVGGKESEITDPIAGLLVGAAKLETARKELGPLNRKQKEVFSGIKENIDGAVAWATQNKMVRKALIGVEVAGLTLSSAGCINAMNTPEATRGFTSTAEVSPFSSETVIDLSTATATNIPPTETQIPKEVDFSKLTPMYEANKGVVITEDDILPDLDIMTGAEQKLRDAGFGNEIDKITDSLLEYAAKSSNLYLHKLEPIYALNTYSDKPVYAVFLYDRSRDCLLYPAATYKYDPSDPKKVPVDFANSGDLTEIIDRVTEKKAVVEFIALTVPVGLGDDVETKLVATKDGIVPGAFDHGEVLVGWFNFGKREWNLTDEARSRLENLYNIENLQENLANWLANTTTIPETEIFVNDGEPIKFNNFDSHGTFGSNIIERHYGVLLGSKIIDGNVFIFVGFEDAFSKRYYLPFNLGVAEDSGCSSTISSVPSQFGEEHFGDQVSTYQCKDLGLIFTGYINKPIILNQFTGEWKDIWNFDLDPSEVEEYETQHDYSLSLAKYIHNSGYGPMGDDKFGGRVNVAPESVNITAFPKLFFSNFTIKK